MLINFFCYFRPENIVDHATFLAPTFEEFGLVQSAMLFVSDLNA
jgi:hypothetical protein